MIDGKGAILGSVTTIDTETAYIIRAMVTDANGKVAISDVTSTELTILDEVLVYCKNQVFLWR